jgi:hypothetical protein
VQSILGNEKIQSQRGMVETESPLGKTSGLFICYLSGQLPGAKKLLLQVK